MFLAKRHLGLALGMMAFSLACTGKYVRPTTTNSIEASEERLERGSYLVNSVTGCPVCHTPRADLSWLNGERADMYLAGGSVFDMPTENFKISIPNITPDPETGIGKWTDDQILRALRDGIHRDEDRLMLPPMPFYMYNTMSDEDARAIVAYLRSVPPVKNKVTRIAELPFMLGMVVKMGGLHHEPVKDVKMPDRSDKKAYGKYLSRIGLCADCHSSTSTGPDEEDNLFGGFDEPDPMPGFGKIYMRNLTPHKENGLGKYNKQQIIDALRSGKRLDGKAMAPPMSLIIPHLSTWTDDDLDALVTYIQSVPAIDREVPERELSDAVKKMIGESN